MTMYPHAIGPIPEETARIARAANPKGTLAMWLRDELGALYRDEEFVDLYPERGQPAFSPWRLALVTLLQYVENLTDRQAAEAVRERIDWKYLLGLELSDAGFDASVLSEWRERLLAHGAEERLLESVLVVCRERGYIRAGGKMRTDATHVLAAVRSLHHLETVGETLRAVLEDLAQVEPDWLVSWMPQEWFLRYEGRMDSRRLPKKEQERRHLAEQIGRDGAVLLTMVTRAQTPEAVQQLASISVLRQVWQHYYEEREGQTHWRDGPGTGAEERIVSPYDPDARRAQKRDTVWCGYKVHVTETCDAELPEVIVQVKTTLAPRPDVKETLGLQQELQQRQLLPAEHLLDGGYMESEILVKQLPGLHIVGPVPPDTSWQAKAGTGYDLAHFQIDWQARQVRCPQGAAEPAVARAASVRRAHQGELCCRHLPHLSCAQAVYPGRTARPATVATGPDAGLTAAACSATGARVSPVLCLAERDRSHYFSRGATTAHAPEPLLWHDESPVARSGHGHSTQLPQAVCLYARHPAWHHLGLPSGSAEAASGAGTGGGLRVSG